MGTYNTKENSEHFAGKIWIHGGNICADMGREELKVIEYNPELAIGKNCDIEKKVKSEIISHGWRLDDWLK